MSEYDLRHQSCSWLEDDDWDARAERGIQSRARADAFELLRVGLFESRVLEEVGEKI